MSTQVSTFSHFLTRDDLEKIAAQFFLEVKGWRWAVGRDWHQIQFPVTQTCQASQRPNFLVVTSLRTITLAFCSRANIFSQTTGPPSACAPIYTHSEWPERRGSGHPELPPPPVSRVCLSCAHGAPGRCGTRQQSSSDSPCPRHPPPICRMEIFLALQGPNFWPFNKMIQNDRVYTVKKQNRL